MTSINGIGAGVPRLDQLGSDRPTRTAEQLEEGAPRRQQAAAHQAKAVYDLPQEASPVSAGVDPQLWEMLSAEERVFYLRNAMSGPLTYTAGDGANASPGTRLGGRLDVRG